MKKKLMGIVTIIAIAAVAGYNVYASYCMVSYFDTCIIRYTNNTFTTCYDSRIRR